jgi:hypothetical protein
MSEKKGIETVDRLVSDLPYHEQLRLIARATQRLSGIVQDEESTRKAKLREYHLKEADWVTEEMKTFVTLIQRYRALYLTAAFLSLGWVLGQALSAFSSNITGSSTAQSGSPPVTIDILRNRPDIAVVLCIVIIINLLFVMLMLEATASVQCLARYRFLLGYELGEGSPVWRWEIWRTIPEGSTRQWTIPLNIFYFILGVGFIIGALVFCRPAVVTHDSIILSALWWFTAITSIGLTLAGIAMGYANRRRSAVSDPPTKAWDQIWGRVSN